MKKLDNDMKKWITLIVILMFAYWIVNNVEQIANIITTLYNVLLPFIIGGALAFILNIPATKIEKRLSKKIKGKQTLIRTISIILSLLLLILILVFIALLLIPELAENIKLLIKNIPALFDKVEVLALDLVEKYPDAQKQLTSFFSGNGSISNIISNILNYMLSGAVGFISSFISSFITLFTALIFAIYMLFQKEYLSDGTKKLLYAYTKKERAEKTIRVGKLANETFQKFISGQCVEAIILGTIIFVVSLICGFPYALFIAVLTAVTALIPIFGAIFAMIIGAILIAITDPIQALIFTLIFLVIQQIEGNLIYPKVVGKSVGLSPLWTLLAISVGGSLFGLVGMLIGLPLASIIFALLKENVENRLETKKIKL